MAVIDKNGSAFDLSYRRTTFRPIDNSSVFNTKEEAKVYALNNSKEKGYVPYAGQIISVLADNTIYKLIEAKNIEEIEERKGQPHFDLDPIGGRNDNDDRYLRRDVAETVQKLMSFLEGINVKGTATLEEITLLKKIVSKNFAVGSTGMGIYQDATGNYHLDIDFVNIRRKLTADEIQVQRSYYVGGKQWITPGAGIVCTSVEDAGSSYKCHFKTTDSEGREVKCLFVPGDLAICETFNLVKLSNEKLGNHYYWRLVTDTGEGYISLSKTACGTNSEAPKAGDEIVHLGNKEDASRQGAIASDAITNGGPYIRVYEGIYDFQLPEPKIDLNPKKSVIKAQLISEATGKDIEDIISEMQDSFDIVKQQTDKEYILWFFDYVPTLSNIPASEWTTAELKTMHEQDMFYNRVSGLAYRFIKSGNAWEWVNITDQQTIKALENAAKAQDTADGKRRVFVEQPTAQHAYDVGDLWVKATYPAIEPHTYNNDQLVCKTAKAAGAAFSIDHWEPSTTATTAYLKNLGDQIILAVTNSDKGIEAAKELASQGISDAYDAAQDALSALGIAQEAQETADKNTATIQVTERSIAALVEGIHIDASGKITNIDTSGLVTTDDFNVLLSKKVNFDSGGHITNISTSGLVTEAGFAQMFSERAEASGYVKRVEISTFITEDDAGLLISNAVISADNINFEGSSFKVGAKNISLEGYITDNKGFSIQNGYMVAKGGTFSGFLKIPFQTFKEGAFRNAAGEYTVSDYFNLEAKGEQFDTYLILNLPTDEKYIGTVLTVYDNPIKTRSSPVVEIKGNMYHPLNVDIYGLKTTTTIKTGKGGVIQFLGVNRHDGCVWYVISDGLGESTRT